jgi:uncharacterized protein YfaS (alpha-2-macroglobulin family)
VEGILSRQRFDGSFGLWSAQGEPEYWTSAYAVEALLRARAAGAAVAPAGLEAALAQLSLMLEDTSADTPEEYASQAARLHALSLAGRPRLGAARRLMENLDALPTPLARAQLGSALARAGDAERAERAFAAALAAPARRDWLYDYGSAARDALAVLVLAQESALPAPLLATLRGRLPGPELTPALASTQEMGWAVLAAATLGQDARPLRAMLDGAPVPARRLDLAGPAVLRNAGEAVLPVQLSVTGTPIEALPAGRNAMTIRRRFLDSEGMALNLETLRAGQSFILALEGRAETGQAHLAMLSQGLPAGWEVVARLGPGAVPGFPGLGELGLADATPALDDRVAAAVTFSPELRSFTLAVRLRAVTAGRFELPGAELSTCTAPPSSPARRAPASRCCRRLEVRHKTILPGGAGGPPPHPPPGIRPRLRLGRPPRTHEDQRPDGAPAKLRSGFVGITAAPAAAAASRASPAPARRASPPRRPAPHRASARHRPR